MPFAIRVRENLSFVQPYLKHATYKGNLFKNITFHDEKGIEWHVDLSIKNLEGEYLILVSNRVKNPLREYKKRWAIERYFKMLKTGGLELEKTKMTDPKRLKILFLLCSMAYLLCVKIGTYRHNYIKQMRWKKKDKCFEFSFFRWGLDWLKELFREQKYVLSELISQAIHGL